MRKVQEHLFFKFHFEGNPSKNGKKKIIRSSQNARKISGILEVSIFIFMNFQFSGFKDYYLRHLRICSS